MVSDLSPGQVSVFGQAKLSNSTVVSSTIYMREKNSQSYWVNVYYGPQWLITPCRIKHFLRITGLQPRPGCGTQEACVNLAVVKVFMRKEKMPYLVDDDAMVEASELLQ